MRGEIALPRAVPAIAIATLLRLLRTLRLLLLLRTGRIHILCRTNARTSLCTRLRSFGPPPEKRDDVHQAPFRHPSASAQQRGLATLADFRVT
jgi:hypothetical protein